MCLNSKNLIHAYGPEKKVLVMPITKTINKIQETAKLKVKKISYYYDLHLYMYTVKSPPPWQVKF